MILQGRWHATTYALSLKAESLSVAINRDEIVACDGAGRLYSVYHDGRHHRRSLNGTVLQKWITDQRQRRWLSETEIDQLIDAAALRFQELRAALSSPDWIWVTPPESCAALERLFTVLERAAHFDSVQARRDAERFAGIYAANDVRRADSTQRAGSHPIGILPPDQYLALVLQATTGCTFNTCTFCDLYQQPFRVKTPAEFRQHVRDVLAYLGDSLSLRRHSVFLGAANALALPMARLLPLFEIIREELRPALLAPLPSRKEGWGEGVYAFLDAFTGIRKSVEDYRALAEHGLKRVYIGLESGHDPLLEFVRKPGRAQDAIETVKTIKAAGINVGLIVMIGLGGERFAAGHATDTITVLNHMPLGTGDLIYFSDLVEEPGTSYPILAEQHGIHPLTAAERAGQREWIRRGLSPGVKISSYDVREFVY